jgi:hypothetical protein
VYVHAFWQLSEPTSLYQQRLFLREQSSGLTLVKLMASSGELQTSLQSTLPAPLRCSLKYARPLAMFKVHPLGLLALLITKRLSFPRVLKCGSPPAASADATAPKYSTWVGV